MRKSQTLPELPGLAEPPGFEIVETDGQGFLRLVEELKVDRTRHLVAWDYIGTAHYHCRVKRLRKPPPTNGQQ